MTAKLSRGDMVRLKTDPTKLGSIQQVRPIDGTVQYQVFFSAHDRPWLTEEDLELFEEGLSFVSRNEFLAHLALMKLRLLPTDSLFSAYASRTKFEAYQFMPALKILSGDSHRMVLADEVGLGKTIEAAIIYLELRARLGITRTLIICPANLSRKWRDELFSRFDEEFTVWDSNDIRRFADDTERYGARQNVQAICSLEMLRREAYVQLLEQAGVTFDLVIVDEAHHMRNPETLSFDLGQYLSRNSDALLLLTATPIQMRLEDLFYLLQLINEGEYRDFSLFEEQIEPNRFLYAAQRALSAIPSQPQEVVGRLRQVETTVLRDRFLQNPYYQECIGDLSTQQALTPERIVGLRRKIQGLNMLSPVLTRTRKRDVKSGARREPQTVAVELSPEEMKFYQAVRNHVRAELGNWGWGAPSFAVTQRERQAASCLPAMRDQLEAAISERRIALSSESTGAEPDEESSTQELPFSEATDRTLLDAMKELRGDSKFDAFYDAINHILEQEPDTKILVFSFFKRTLSYLRNRLRSRGVAAELINGDIPVSQRHEVVERFRDDPGSHVLLSSEVGAEGHDFQFCSVIVNYDLPWNPMRVEQRIGRLDRYGQLNPKIRVVNLVLSDTIEERILYRLYQRLGVFQEAIGDLEAILGPLMREVERDLLRKDLTPEQEIEEGQKLILVVFEEREDAGALEARRLELMGQDIIFQQQAEEAVEYGRFLSAEELAALVRSFIRGAAPRSTLDDNEDGSFFLTDGGDLLPHISASIPLRERTSEKLRDFLSKLDDRGIPITFNAELAQSRKLLHFVTIRHPLVRVARAYHDSHGYAAPERRLVLLRVQTQGITRDHHYFFIFSLRVSGASESTTLVPLVISPYDGAVDKRLSKGLLSDILRANDSDHGSLDRDDYTLAFDYALEHMNRVRDAEKQEAHRRNEALITEKAAALDRTYEVKVAKVRQHLSRASDERIRRMKESQLRNIEIRHRTQREDVDKRRQVMVDYQLVAAGHILYE